MVDLAQAIATFLIFKRGEALTRRTVEWYAAQLGHFAAFTGTRAVAAIGPLDIAQWLVYQQERGLSPLTVDGGYRALLAFFNWCEYSPDAGCVPSPIGHGHHKAVKRPKVDEPDMDFVSFEEYITLTTAIDLGSWIDYRDWCMIGVMFWCGVRRGELLQMELRDVDYVTARIRIRHSKARRQRSIFLLDDLMAGLRQYLALRPAYLPGASLLGGGNGEGTALWASYDKARLGLAGALTATGLRLMLIRRCRRAHVRFLHPHLFRHGFAMAYLNHGVDLKAVGDLMGHSSYKTTEKHYAKWIEEPLRRLHQQTAEAILRGM
jgi:integrase